MCKPNHLLKRGSVYYVRVRVPTDLLDHFHPKKDLVRSLRTSDYKEACLKVRTASLQIIKEFEELRRIKASSQTSITSDDIKRITDLWVAHILEEDEEMRNEGLSDQEYTALEEAYEIVGDEERKRLARGRPDLDDFEVKDFLESNGFHLDAESEIFRRIAQAFLKALRKVVWNSAHAIFWEGSLSCGISRILVWIPT